MVGRARGTGAVFQRTALLPILLFSVLLVPSCTGNDPGQPLLTAEIPLHLEDHIDAAVIEGSRVAEDLFQPVEWRFDKPQPGWRPLKPKPAEETAVNTVQLDDALRLSLSETNRDTRDRRLYGAILINVPNWNLGDWGYVEVRARASDGMRRLGVAFNHTETDSLGGLEVGFPVYALIEGGFLVTDGTVQTYQIPLDQGFVERRSLEGPWTHLGIWCNSQADEDAGTLDILSVRVIPHEAEFAGDLVRPVEWRFDEPQPDWKPVKPTDPQWKPVEPVRVDDALRLHLTANNRADDPRLIGVICVELPDWNLDDWAYVEVRARGQGPLRYVGLVFNITDEDPLPSLPVFGSGDRADLVPDGTVQTYRLSLDRREMRRRGWKGPWTHLGIWFNSQADEDAVTLDLLSVRVIPREAEFAGDAMQPAEWHFDEPQPDWRPADPIDPQWEAVKPVRVDDALRISLADANRQNLDQRLIGTIYVDVPDWNLDDWASVEIRARARGRMRRIGLSFNYTEEDHAPPITFPFYCTGARVDPRADGTVQTYRLSLDRSEMRRGGWEGPWTHLGIWFNSQDVEEKVTLDLLSVRVIPHEAEFAGVGVGVRSEGRRATSGDVPYRRTLYTHAPGKISFRVEVPENGRLDVGLGVLRQEAPVAFAIRATPVGGEVETLLEETYSDRAHWGQRSVDLSRLAGQEITLALEAECERPGTVALWGAPTLTGLRTTDKPNVVFYVIDGAGAEYMSVYGYNRRTTPNLEKLAAEGAVFERAYSNSSWTRPSTASFMTSLQNSVLGGITREYSAVSDNAPTMAEHMHRAGYQTAVFTPNPNAGRMSGLDRGVDFFQENWGDFVYVRGGGTGDSSRVLHEAFWRWRETYPAEPYWVHFQPVDIHGNFPAVAPFGGLFVGPEQARTWFEWDDRWSEHPGDLYSDGWEEIGVDRVEFFTVRQGLYDESMAHNDYQIGRLVERLKATGEWENTLLIVGADHSTEAGNVDMGITILDELPPPWSRAMFRPSISRIPLIFVWPDHIAGGQRFREPVVSMIDVLPTVLDLVGLPPPEIAQGQSLAPLLRGEGTWEARPVILDEFRIDPVTGEFSGLIEVVDGRWGASLEINPRPEQPEEERRPVPLLLYDLWSDPYCLHSLHEERPDLVEKYTAFLEEQFVAHRELGTQFTPGTETALTPEQLRSLRALGYIQ